MAILSYSVAEPALGSPVEEWQPHAKQRESTEWCYSTAVVRDTAGNPYFLVWCPFHFTGKKSSPASTALPGHKRAITAIIGFTDYRDGFRIGHFPTAVVNEADTWDPTTNAVRFVAGEYSSEWSYKVDAMNLTVASPQLGLRSAPHMRGRGDVRQGQARHQAPKQYVLRRSFAPHQWRRGETAGVAVTESMDIRIMQNAPYAANQH